MYYRFLRAGADTRDDLLDFLMATRVGPGRAAQNATTSLVLPDSRREQSSPDSRSTVTASTFAASTSKPAQLRTCVMSAPP